MSYSGEMPPQPMGGPMQPMGNMRVPNLPRLPYIQTQAQNPEMGRASEAAFCKRCGTIANTNIKYIKGAFACRWAWWMALGGNLACWTCFFCLCGCPHWTKVHYYDVCHFCQNCDQKLGYNYQRWKCCGTTSYLAKEMPD